MELKEHPQYKKLLSKLKKGEIDLNNEYILQLVNAEISEIDNSFTFVNDIDESKLQWIEILENLLYLINSEYFENKIFFDLAADPSLEISKVSINKQNAPLDILSNPLGYQYFYDSFLARYSKAFQIGFYNNEEQLIDEIQKIYNKLASLIIEPKYLNPRALKKSLLRRGLIDFHPRNWEQDKLNSFFSIVLPKREIKIRIRILQILNKVRSSDWIDDNSLNTEISQLAVELKDSIDKIKTDFYCPDRKTLYCYGLTSLENLLFVETNKISKSSFIQNGYDNLESIRETFNIYNETINRQISLNSNKSEISKFLLIEKQKNKTMILDNNVKELNIQSLPRLAYSYTKIRLKEELGTETIPKETSIAEQEKDQYPAEIFPNITSYKLFISLTEEFGKKHSDITFIYRIMVFDKFIHQHSESEFRRWLKEKGICDINSKIQQIDRTEKTRKDRYLKKLTEYNLVSKHYKNVSK